MHCDLFPTRIYVEQNFLESEEFDEIKLLVKTMAVCGVTLLISKIVITMLKAIMLMLI